jgi:O-antigen ligase
VLAVAQFRIMAPAVTIALLLSIAAHWRNHGTLPWPRPAPMLVAAGALLLVALATAFWSVEGWRALGTVASLGALVLLGAMAARAVAEDGPEHLRRMGAALVVGLALGAAVLAFDHATDNLFRRAVRGFPPPSMQIGFGLKPAACVLALLLPLVLAVPGLRPWLRWSVLAGGSAAVLWLPGEAAKLSMLAGLGAAALGFAVPRLAARAGAVALAGFFLFAPLVFSAALPLLPDLSALPRSAAHRVLIWDFVGEQIADRPFLGWGMESSRAIPGGDDTFPPSTLARFGLDAPEEQAFFALPSTKRLPLHPHNAALQVWLELGVLGAVLAAVLAAAVMLAARSPAALGAAAAGAVTGALAFGVWQPWWIASLLLAVVTLAGLAPLRR